MLNGPSSDSLEMSSHRIGREEGQESLQNANKAVEKGKHGEIVKFAPE